MKSTLFDPPSAIKIAQTVLDDIDLSDRIIIDLSDRIIFVPGDYYKDLLQCGHDLALLMANIHQNSPG